MSQVLPWYIVRAAADADAESCATSALTLRVLRLLAGAGTPGVWRGCLRRDPGLIVVRAGGSKAGLDVIVCPVGESAGRAGEVAAVGLLCYPVSEFARGLESVQAGREPARETGTGRDGFRLRLGRDVVGEFAVGGPHLGCGRSEGWVKPVRGPGEVVPA